MWPCHCNSVTNQSFQVGAPDADLEADLEVDAVVVAPLVGPTVVKEAARNSSESEDIINCNFVVHFYFQLVCYFSIDIFDRYFFLVA